MNKAIIISCLLFLGTINWAYAKSFQGFSLGASGGYTNYRTFGGEGYFQVNLKLFQRPFEPKAGISYRTFTTNYYGASHLDAGSFGVFVEGVIYPFYKHLFVGVRWEALNMNFLTDNAVIRANEQSVYPTRIFAGTSGYGVVGVDIPVTDALSFRVYAMPGIHTYSIYEIYEGTDLESYTKFVFQVNAGIAIRIFNKKYPPKVI